MTLPACAHRQGGRLDLREREVVVDGALRIALHDRVHAEREPRVDVERVFLDDRFERRDRFVELAGFAFGAREHDAHDVIAGRRFGKLGKLFRGRIVIVEGAAAHTRARGARRASPAGFGKCVARLARECRRISGRAVAIEEAQRFPPQDRIAALAHRGAERVRVRVGDCGQRVHVAGEANGRSVRPRHRRGFALTELARERRLQRHALR